MLCYVTLYFLLLCCIFRHCTAALFHACPISSQTARTPQNTAATLTHMMIFRVDLVDGIQSFLMMTMISEVAVAPDRLVCLQLSVC